MEPSGYFLLAAAGCAAGFMNVMAGGGTLLTMPVLVLLGLDGPYANGTNRVAILLQNAGAVASFRKRGFSDFRLSLSLALAALPGAVLGAYFGTKLSGVWFNRVLAAVMVVVLALVLKGPAKGGPVPGRPKNLLAGHLLTALAGVYGGFIQAGVGFLLMFVLHRVMGLDLVRVNMHKVFIIGVYTLAALAVFAWRGQVLWAPGLALAAGNAAGGWIGARASVKGGERAIRAVFAAAVLLLAANLLFR